MSAPDWSLFFCFVALAGLLLFVGLTWKAPETPSPTYDYDRLQFCLIDRGFPYATLDDGQRDLRFCIEYDQAVQR